jgi:hypothetical protein
VTGMIETAEFEERREPRGALGFVFKWALVLFQLWIVIEVLWMFGRVNHAMIGAPGLARAIGEGMVGRALMGWLTVWAIGTVVLAMGAYATRGNRVLVRRVAKGSPGGDFK